MAPIATSDTTTTTLDIGQRIGQLKLNVSTAPAAAPVVQEKKKETVRVVDPFNYVVGRSVYRHHTADEQGETYGDGPGSNYEFADFLRTSSTFDYGMKLMRCSIQPHSN
jgi:hypothetical protein